jgi:hypothetical protein
MTIEQFDFTVDITKSLLWQYNDAEKLQTILTQQQSWLDQNVKNFWDGFITDIFDLRTVNDFGCHVWAVILGVHFSIQSDVPPVWFNFLNSNGTNFSHGGFYPSSGIILTTEQKRTILQLRYRQITSNATVDEMYRAVIQILPITSIIDNLNMTVTITAVTPDYKTQFIIDNYDVISRPAGVKIIWNFT